MNTSIKELRLLIREMVREAVDQNNDKKNDFKDVKIARMSASGMSKEDIKKKHPDLFEDLDDLDEDLLGEPDLSSEDERDYSKDEFNTVAGGAIRGYQAPLGYSHKHMKGYKKRKK